MRATLAPAMPEIPESDDFEALRPALFGVAYRMLGTASEAEDMVQEAWIRWRSAAPAEVRSLRSYLVTIVTRLCLDYLRSARVQREQYLGPWLPEPVPTARLIDSHTPEDAAEAVETISYAFLVVLERLAPVERAVFLLRDVFDFDYAEIAEIVAKSEPACRQILRRARLRLTDGEVRFACSYEQRLRLTEQFVRAAGAGDVNGLVALLAEDVTLWSDGGGKVPAAINALRGRERVVKLMLGLRKGIGPHTRIADLNGVPAVITYGGGLPVNVILVEPGKDGIGAIRVVRNPGKLTAIVDLIA